MNQYLLIQLTNQYPVTLVQQAIAQCLILKLNSAVSCRDITKFLLQSSTTAPVEKQPGAAEAILSSDSITPVIRTEHRSIAAYLALYGVISS